MAGMESGGLSTVTYKGRKIIIVHAIIKKTQKTPSKDLRIARKRMQELQ